MLVREIRLEDYDGIRLLRIRNDFKIVPSYERWSEYWLGNPFRQEFRDLPMGLVLENDQHEIVGAIDYFHHMYEWKGQRLRAMAASSWVVDSNYRAHSIGMIGRLFAAQGPDLLLNTTAAPVVRKLWQAFRTKSIPLPRDVCYRWLTSYPGVVASLLRHGKIPLSGFLKYPAAAAARVLDLFRGKNRLGKRNKKVRLLEEFDGRFDDLWGNLRHAETGS